MRPTVARSLARRQCRSGVHTGDSRIRNDLDIEQLTITVDQADVTVLDIGTTSAPITVVVANTGTVPAVSTPILRGPGRADWSVSADRCPDTLAAAATCEVDVVATMTAEVVLTLGSPCSCPPAQ